MLQTPPAEELERTFRDVLSAPEFVPVSDSVMVRVMRALRRVWDAIWELLFPSGLEVGPMEWVARLVAILAILSVVFLIVRAVRAAWAGPTRSRSGPEAATAPRDAAAWVRWARQRSAEGRCREAATGLYQAALLELDSGGLLSYREWKTPGDYADEVCRDDPTGHAFLEFLRAFLSVAFGSIEADRASIEALERRVMKLGVRA